MEKHMDNFDKNFNTVFDGISKTMNAIDKELDLLKTINDAQKIELKKAKRFNIFMLVIALASFVGTIIGVVIPLLTK